MALTHPESNALTERIIGFAIEIHREYGPGLREIVYDDCLYWDIYDANLSIDRQRRIPLKRRSRVIAPAFIADLIVNDQVIIEVKCVEKVIPVHKAQLLTYMKLTQIPVGLLLNFNVDRLIDGITRLSL
jgi:GxxExxY protein